MMVWYSCSTHFLLKHGSTSLLAIISSILDKVQLEYSRCFSPHTRNTHTHTHTHTMHSHTHTYTQGGEGQRWRMVGREVQRRRRMGRKGEREKYHLSKDRITIVVQPSVKNISLAMLSCFVDCLP